MSQSRLLSLFGDPEWIRHDSGKRQTKRFHRSVLQVCGWLPYNANYVGFFFHNKVNGCILVAIKSLKHQSSPALSRIPFGGREGARLRTRDIWHFRLRGEEMFTRLKLLRAVCPSNTEWKQTNAIFASLISKWLVDALKTNFSKLAE